MLINIIAVIVFFAVLGILLYGLNRSIDAYFAAQKARWDTQVAITQLLIDQAPPHTGAGSWRSAEHPVMADDLDVHSASRDAGSRSSRNQA